MRPLKEALQSSPAQDGANSGQGTFHLMLVDRNVAGSWKGDHFQRLAIREGGPVEGDVTLLEMGATARGRARARAVQMHETDPGGQARARRQQRAATVHPAIPWENSNVAPLCLRLAVCFLLGSWAVVSDV